VCERGPKEPAKNSSPVARSRNRGVKHLYSGVHTGRGQKGEMLLKNTENHKTRGSESKEKIQSLEETERGQGGFLNRSFCAT